eukprot:m.218110 g.218110  ORF g.218110 m.218110 type:complete len:431 (-) comp10788_c7_seq25:1964-3256(-)
MAGRDALLHRRAPTSELEALRSRVLDRERESAAIDEELRLLQVEDEVAGVAFEQLRLEEIRSATEKLDREVEQREMELMFLQRIEEQEKLKARQIWDKYMARSDMNELLDHPEDHLTSDQSQILREALEAHKQRHETEAKQRNEDVSRLQQQRDAILERRRELQAQRTNMLRAEYERDRRADPISSILKSNPTLEEQEVALDRLRVKYLPGTVARKQYAGELGIASYKPHQIPVYRLCRSVIWDIVEDALALPDFELACYHELAQVTVDIPALADKELQLTAGQIETLAWGVFMDIKTSVIEDAIADIHEELCMLNSFVHDRVVQLFVKAAVNVRSCLTFASLASPNVICVQMIASCVGELPCGINAAVSPHGIALGRGAKSNVARPRYARNDQGRPPPWSSCGTPTTTKATGSRYWHLTTPSQAQVAAA